MFTLGFNCGVALGPQAGGRLRDSRPAALHSYAQ